MLIPEPLHCMLLIQELSAWPYSLDDFEGQGALIDLNPSQKTVDPFGNLIVDDELLQADSHPPRHQTRDAIVNDLNAAQSSS